VSSSLPLTWINAVGITRLIPAQVYDVRDDTRLQLGFTASLMVTLREPLGRQGRLSGFTVKDLW
jgi:hypothetical protein